jgi:hypothetical protein
LGAVACQREREKQDALLKVERARIYADYSKRAKQNWKNYQVLLSEKQARTCYHQDNVRTWNGDFSPRHKPEYVITCKVAVPGYHINTVVCDQDHCENKS